MRILDFPLWLRAAHFFNFLLLSLLVRSGLEILSAHPRFYWNDHCTPGSEWLKFTKKQRPKDRLWTASDAVSYTHLDVYKRQDLEFTAAIRVAMENPDACERWLAGDAVFAGCEAKPDRRRRLPLSLIHI